MYGPDGDDWEPEDLFGQYGADAVEFQVLKWRLPRGWRAGDPPESPRSVEELAAITGVSVPQIYAFDEDLTSKLQSDTNFRGDLEFFGWSLDQAPERWRREYR